MAYRLSRPAQADLADIWDYIAQDKPVAADRFIDFLGKRLALLAAQPEMGRACNELRPGLRRLSARKYVIFYRIEFPHIEIARILHGARDIESIFETQTDF